MAAGYTLSQTGQEVQDILNDVENKTVYDNATQSQAGLMSSGDKTKLDDLQALTILEIEELLNF